VKACNVNILRPCGCCERIKVSPSVRVDFEFDINTGCAVDIQGTQAAWIFERSPSAELESRRDGEFGKGYAPK
jgi:hypothetical protein